MNDTRELEAIRRRQRNERVVSADGSAFRHGVKVSAEDAARTDATRARNAELSAEAGRTGRVGESPSSAFRGSASTGDTLADYAGERTRQLRVQNDAAEAPARSAEAAAQREQEIVSRQNETVEKAFRTRTAIQTGTPMPAGVSVSMGGDPNKTIDNPGGSSLSGAFKDGSKYSLSGRTRDERMADAKRQGIYERLIDENPGDYAESKTRSRAKGQAQTTAARTAFRDTGTLPGLRRTADGGISMTADTVREDEAQLASQGIASPFRQAAPAAPAPVVAQQMPAPAPSPAAPAPATSAANFSATAGQQRQMQEAAALSSAGIPALAPTAITGGMSTNAPAQAFRSQPSLAQATAPMTAVPQQQVAAAITGPTPQGQPVAGQPMAGGVVAAPVTPYDVLMKQLQRREAAGRGTPVTRTPANPVGQPTASLTNRRRPPLVTAFRSAVA